MPINIVIVATYITHLIATYAKLNNKIDASTYKKLTLKAPKQQLHIVKQM